MGVRQNTNRHNTNSDEQLQTSENKIKTTFLCLSLFKYAFDSYAYSLKDKKPSLNYTDANN